jgi:NAD(P)-dependent dehydrogenase (short-subunit alcohol dehydrogenase family)
LTLVYARALRADGIKVNSVSPGLVPTDLNSAAGVPLGERTTADGAVLPVLYATLGLKGPSGVFMGSPDAAIPW